MLAREVDRDVDRDGDRDVDRLIVRDVVRQAAATAACSYIRQPTAMKDDSRQRRRPRSAQMNPHFLTCTSNHNTHGAIGDRCASDRVGDEGQTRVVAKGQCAAHPHQTETDGCDASLLGRPFEPRNGEDSNKRQSDTGSRSQQEMDRRRRQDRPIAARLRLSPTRSSRTTRTTQQAEETQELAR